MVQYWDNTPSLLEADMRWLVACGVLAGVLAGITINYAIKEVCHSRRHATGDATLKKLQVGHMTRRWWCERGQKQITRKHTRA